MDGNNTRETYYKTQSICIQIRSYILRSYVNACRVEATTK